MMEAVGLRTSEKSVYSNETARRCIPEGSHLLNYSVHWTMRITVPKKCPIMRGESELNTFDAGRHIMLI
jgi:hypothetical protein